MQEKKIFPLKWNHIWTDPEGKTLLQFYLHCREQKTTQTWTYDPEYMYILEVTFNQYTSAACWCYNILQPQCPLQQKTKVKLYSHELQQKHLNIRPVTGLKRLTFVTWEGI